MVDVFAEGFARHVLARIELFAACGPRRRAAVEHLNARVAEACQPFRGGLRQSFSAVAEHDARAAIGHERRKPHFQTTERNVRRDQQVSVAGADAFFTDIEYRELVAVPEHAAQLAHAANAIHVMHTSRPSSGGEYKLEQESACARVRGTRIGALPLMRGSVVVMVDARA